MVKLENRLDRIKRSYVSRGKYFVINRGRQYGKTTTLKALAEYLKEEYLVVSMDFQGIGTDEFRNEKTFADAFAKMFLVIFERVCENRKEELSRPLKDFLTDQENKSLRGLFAQLSKLCGNVNRPIVLMIDEVDSASNNQVFIDFLAQLRKYYLDRDNTPIFFSVILAGVYDIKNLKLKLRSDEEHQYNSPWNIAARFTLDMSFSVSQISDMLSEYEKDHQTDMDVEKVAYEIYQYTSGYPYLVSAICKYLDEEVPMQKGFEKFLKEENGYVAVANRIFEIYLLNLFIAEESVKSEMFLYGQEKY